MRSGRIKVCVLFTVLLSSCHAANIRWSPFMPWKNVAEGKLTEAKDGRFHRAQAVSDYVGRNLLEMSSELRSILSDVVAGSEADAVLESNLRENPDDYCGEENKDVDKALKALDDLFNVLQNDNDTCPVCVSAFTLLQRLACLADYKKLVDGLIIVCEVFMDKTGSSNPAMCNGTITLQAPFVYTALRECTPYDYCETLNMCFPPPDEISLTVNEKVSRLLQPTRDGRDDVTQSQKRSKTSQIKMLHLADIHISTVYATGSATDCGMYVCCLEEFPGNGSARPYGEYSCNIPERTMHHFLRAAKELQPDFVIYTGDSPPHTIWEESLQSQLNCSSIVIRALQEHFPDIRVYPSIGNHEMFPTNIYTMDERYNNTATMNQQFTEMWRHLAGFESEQEETMRRMAYYTLLIPGYNNKLRILAINTNHYWYSLNFMAPLNRNRTEEEEHRRFITDTLSAARQNGEKVIVIGHHPVTSLDSTIRATRWWEQVVLNFSDVIVMMLSGHTHSDEFHLFVDWESGLAKLVNYVALSVTSNTLVNPSLRMFYLDDVTFDVLNYENYYADMDTQQADTPPPVKLNYDAKETYALEDLSPESWKQLSNRFIDDDELFQLWHDNRQAKAVLDPCTEECRRFQICSMWFVNYDEVESCVDDWDDGITSACVSPTPVILLHLCPLLVLLLLVA